MSLNSKHPKLLTHKDVLSDQNFFSSAQYIVNKSLDFFSNRCPHRGNKIIPPGTCKNVFKCGLHGWEWDEHGSCINNSVSLKSRKINCGTSGILFLDWQEPVDAQWVRDLSQDSFRYHHSTSRIGTGDWRWQMEMHVDLLHVEQIHPALNSYVDCTKLKTEYGNDWIAQYHEHGWWLFVYPFTHIEWEPGCLYFSEMSPRENDQGYDVYIHYLFNDSVTEKQKNNFITMAETTFDEDILAVNEISANSKYRMPANATHPLEKDIHHFYSWIEENTDYNM